MKYNNFSIKKQIRKIEKQEICRHYKMLADKERQLIKMNIDFNSGRKIVDVITNDDRYL